MKRKPGRPKLPKGEAKGKIVPIRFTKQLKRAGAADIADFACVERVSQTRVTLRRTRPGKKCV